MQGSPQPTVVVVEDDPDTAEVISDLLSRAGLLVIICSESDNAHMRIAASQAQLVILDVQMPGVDGIEVFEQLRADPLTDTIPVIFFTFSGDLLRRRLVVDKARGATLLAKPNVMLLPELALRTLAAHPA